MSSTTTTTIETKKESLGISAALILSLVGLTLVLVIAVLIKREIRRGNVKWKREGHFWSCKFFGKYARLQEPKDGKPIEKLKPPWLLVTHHELPEHYYGKDECPQYLARMFTIDLYTVLQHTCREIFADVDSDVSIETYLINNYPALNETLQTFRRLKIRAEVDLVPFTLDDTKHTVDLFNQLLQRLSEFVNNPYLRQRQLDSNAFNSRQLSENEHNKTSSQYLPLLPKDLCHIPLRAIDDDSLTNMNKRSRSKGRFPFQLPSFLHKRRFFSERRRPAKSPPRSRSELSATIHSTTDEPAAAAAGINDDLNLNNSSSELMGSFENPVSKQTRQRLKRQGATDVVPLVEFHDTLSSSTTFSSESIPRS